MNETVRGVLLVLWLLQSIAVLGYLGSTLWLEWRGRLVVNSKEFYGIIVWNSVCYLLGTIYL